MTALPSVMPRELPTLAVMRRQFSFWLLPSSPMSSQAPGRLYSVFQGIAAQELFRRRHQMGNQQATQKFPQKVLGVQCDRTL